MRDQMLAPAISETRDNEGFAQHIRQTSATDPTAGWVFVLDNLNTRCGAAVVRLAAEELGLDPGRLGARKKGGVLESMAGRRAFLSDPSRRVRFVYLPKHSSWLNPIEIIFGIINRRLIRRGTFTFQADLIDKLRRFLGDFNDTLAQPMNWTCTGRPTRWISAKPPRATLRIVPSGGGAREARHCGPAALFATRLSARFCG